jgi:putative membrane protein
MVVVANADSLNHSMNSALKHYSSMFFLPTFQKAAAAVALICIGGVGLSTSILFFSATGLLSSLSLGVSLLAAIILADYITSKVVLRRDPIYVLRRAVALSLFCWFIWVLFAILGVILGLFLGILWWVRLCLFGFAAVLTFRAVIFISTSSVGFLKRIAASFLSPILCVAVFMVFWHLNLDSTIAFQFLPFLLIAPVIGWVAASLFVSLLDRLGRRVYGAPSIPLFRAFMLNWVAALNEPFENFLEKLGEDEDVETNLLKFGSDKTKAAIIVPLVHPGPFKNIGSSLLPSMLKHDFEREFNCEACVPLGILGHELDLASQAQNHKIIAKVIDSANFSITEEKATPFVKITKGFATASCQVFGKIAFLSFTLAPKTTEDLPQQLGRVVLEEAKNLGLKYAVVVNAHNSINDSNDAEVSLEELRKVASQCLKKAISLPSRTFEIGASTLFPEEFNLKEGMGPGGITAIVVKVADQKTAYVVIDGNNMVSGLRERILGALKKSGFDESEVFTTDTHAVSALVLGRRGYHPVGEVMNNELLIRHIQEVSKAAEKTLETSKAGCSRIIVPKIRVIGQNRIESLSLLVDKTLQRAKQIVAPVFVSEGLFLILLLAFL